MGERPKRPASAGKAKRAKVIGEWLRQKREAAELTQLCVAKFAGYEVPQFVSNMERGITLPPIEFLKLIIKLYKISAAEIIEVMGTTYREYLFEELAAC